jgi:hypothetical protein
MQAVDSPALEAAAWSGFVERLGQHLAAQWPAMPQRLGDRYQAFVELACAQANERGLNQAAAVARYVNLCFVWGPGFQDKPGFEWARGLLASPPERERVTAHQLLQRSLLELQRLPSARIDAQTLSRSDASLLDQFGALGRRGDMRRSAYPVMPRQACDLEALELKLLIEPALQVYTLAGDAWQRVPAPASAPLRADLARPLPNRVSALSFAPAQGTPVSLQVRARAHAVCNGDVHPAIGFLGSHGQWRWAGHETRAVSWPLYAREQRSSPLGPGVALAEETSPELDKIVLEVCGLRDEGDPVGGLQAQVSVWPAEQWWLELRRGAAVSQTLLPAHSAWAAGVTRCRVERDGVAQDGVPLTEQFQSGLDAACADGLKRLNEAWSAVPGLGSARAELLLGVLTGQASCTWGWQLGATGLGAAAFMRVLAQFDLEACRADLQWGGELSIADTRTRLTLQTEGVARLKQEVRCEAAVPGVAASLLPLTATWQFPFSLSLEPVASAPGALLQQAGPVSGHLSGAAGWRPCTAGSSGWEWFVQLRLTAISVPLQIVDPVLGSVSFDQPLLPAMVLVDWSPR